MSILTISPVLKGILGIILTIGFFLALLIPGILTMCLATLRAKKPIKDVLDSDKLKDICFSQRLLLIHGKWDRNPKERKNPLPIRFMDFVKTAMMLLVIGAVLGLFLRLLFGNDSSFWGCSVAIELVMTFSIFFTMFFFVDQYAPQRGWHVFLLAIPAALLGGLINCI